jgi:DNA polymerase III delta prime subunit
MAEFDPSRETYLAVVSEWTGLGKTNASRVGNAYPLYSFTSNRAVAEPLAEFPNPGYVFLVNRGDLHGGDFVRVQPSENFQKPYKDTDCAFVVKGTAMLMDAIGPRVAVVLDVPTFDPESAETIIRRPEQPVTPIFFIKSGAKYFGPFARDKTVSGPVEGVFDALHWSAAGRDHVFYEFAPGMLKAQGVSEVVYEPVQPVRNEVIRRPYRLLVGPVDRVTSSHPHDRLPEPQLAEWYLKTQKLEEIPGDMVQRLRAAADALPEGVDEVVRQRCRRVGRLFMSLTALQSERAAVAGRHLKTDEGKKALDEAIRREVEVRSRDLEQMVQAQQAELVEQRQRLATQLEQVRREHEVEVGRLEGAIRKFESRRETLAGEERQVHARIRDGIAGLVGQIREQVPLVAALAGGIAPAAAAAAHAPAPEPGAPGWDVVGPAEPTKLLAPCGDEATLVNRLTAELAAGGLGFARDFVANLYVSMKAQGLNLIMGPPGHGKSSAVTALARALGHGHALLEVAVRRTWSDDRYLLGFFDSFHGRYDPGPTGLATRLVQAMRDWESDRRGVYVVLLDEFNLAAPEYYFSQLLQLVTRPAEQPRVLRLYDPAMLPAGAPASVDTIRLPPSVSFWGTINYDETTERLSPRLLDRTGMIFLGPGDIVPANGASAGLPKGVTAGQLFGEFIKKADCCPDESWEIVRPLLDHLSEVREGWGPAVNLSPRVLEGVRRFLANADGILAPRVAADFAFQQRVLPVVRGRGPAFAARTRALGELLTASGLERSNRQVRDALALADAHYGDIDFLAYV